MATHADSASRLLKSLANAQRLRILCLLVTGESSVGALHVQLDLSQSALSQHLARLREDGLVITRREAQTIHYRLASGPAERVIQTLHGIYCPPRAEDVLTASPPTGRPGRKRR
ncbi:MAG: helix-turn-helix transcriptional regulator [Proteobacteria bacterium]|nr:helix-turn-helix transcriptional regulator [Pseudomonadota bacterium]